MLNSKRTGGASSLITLYACNASSNERISLPIASVIPPNSKKIKLSSSVRATEELFFKLFKSVVDNLIPTLFPFPEAASLDSRVTKATLSSVTSLELYTDTKVDIKLDAFTTSSKVKFKNPRPISSWKLNNIGGVVSGMKTSTSLADDDEIDSTN